MSDGKADKQPKQVKIKVQLDEEMSLGDYVNMARIFHNPTEFVVDAMFLPPQSQIAKVVSRLILSPVHAKFLFKALGHNIQLYEKKFGEIVLQTPGGTGDTGPILH